MLWVSADGLRVVDDKTKVCVHRHFVVHPLKAINQGSKKALLPEKLPSHQLAESISERVGL